jgi:hypothetical protein
VDSGGALGIRQAGNCPAARIGFNAKNSFVRNAAAEVLGEVGTKSDVPALIHALRVDKDWVVRASAASSLGEHRTKASVAALEHAIARDRYWCVRAYAVDALCRTGEQRFIELIEARLAREPEPAVLPSLYAAMVAMGRSEYLEKNIDLLYDPSHSYLVYVRACLILEHLVVLKGLPLSERAIKGLKLVRKYDVGKAASWAARDLLNQASRLPPGT